MFDGAELLHNLQLRRLRALVPPFYPAELNRRQDVTMTLSEADPAAAPQAVNKWTTGHVSARRVSPPDAGFASNPLSQTQFGAMSHCSKYVGDVSYSCFRFVQRTRSC